MLGYQLQIQLGCDIFPRKGTDGGGSVATHLRQSDILKQTKSSSPLYSTPSTD